MVSSSNGTETSEIQNSFDVLIFKTKENRAELSKALIYLEDLKGKGYPFSPDQFRKIQEARQWLDANQKENAQEGETKLAPPAAATDARALLEQASGTTNDPVKWYDLLQQARSIAPEEDAVLKAQIEESFLSWQARQTPTAITNLELLKDNSDVDKMTGALVILEGLVRRQYRFTLPQLEKITVARQWIDNKQQNDGNIISSARYLGAQVSYVIWQQFMALQKREKYYIDLDGAVYPSDIWTGMLRKAWVDNSEAALDKRIRRAQNSAKINPSDAKANLEHDLKAHVEKEFENKFLGKKEKRTIPEFPFTDEDAAKAREYADLLDGPSRIFQAAQNFQEDAQKSAAPYTRYELLIKARNQVWRLPDDPVDYGLPRIDEAIYEAYEPAVKNRCNEIELVLDRLQPDIEKLLTYGANFFTGQADKLKEGLDRQISATSLWPGDGYVLHVTIPGKAPEFTIQKPVQLEGLGKRCQALAARLSELQHGYEVLDTNGKKIRAGLAREDDESRQEALTSFSNLEKDSSLNSFAIFRELETFVNQQGDFENSGNLIRESFERGDWLGVLAGCQGIEAKEGFATKCPAKIRLNVSKWKTAADANLRYQNLKDLIQKQNYRLADRVLNGLRNSKADLQPVINEVNRVEEIKKSGQSMQDFFALALNPYGLDGHILIDILLEQEEIFARLKQLRPQDVQTVHKILGNMAGEVTREQIENNITSYLQGIFQQTSLEKKAELLRKLNLVAGLPVEAAPQWPSPVVCLARYEARILAGYLAIIVKRSALSVLQAATATIEQGINQAKVRPAIQAIHEFEFKLSDEETDLLRNVEVAWAIAYTNSLSPNQTDEKKKAWEDVKSHFGFVGDIGMYYSAVKTEWYVNQARRYRANKDFEGALQKISEGFNDEDVGTIWQLYLEKAGICVEMGKFDEALDALGHFGPGKAHPEISETRHLHTNIDLGKISRSYQGNPLGELKTLVEYRQIAIPKTVKLVDDAIHSVYETGKRNCVTAITNALSSDRGKAWSEFLLLRGLEDAFLGFEKNASRGSEEFLTQLLPSLYSGGLQLLDDYDVFDAFCNKPSVLLEECLVKCRPLLARIGTYILFLKDLMRDQQIPGDAALDKIVRDIISISTDNDSLRKQLLADLDQSILPATQNQKMKFKELTNDEAALNKKLISLEESKRNWESAKDAGLWFDSAKRVMVENNNQTDGWSQIKTKYNSQDLSYLEIKTISQAINAWDVELKSLNKDYIELRNSYADEKFIPSNGSSRSSDDGVYENVKEADALSCTNKIDARFSSLPDFSLAGGHANVITRLGEELEVKNSYTSEKIKSLRKIEISILSLQKELEDWEKYKRNEEELLNNLNKKIEGFRAHISIFQAKYTDLSHFLTGAEKMEREDALKKYLKAVSNLLKEKEDIANTLPVVPIPFMAESVRTEEASASIIETNARQKSKLWLPWKKKQPVRQMKDPLVDAIRSSARIDFPLQNHAIGLNQIIGMNELIGDANKSADGKPLGLNVSSLRAKDYLDECDRLVRLRAETKSRLVEALTLHQACMSMWAFPDAKIFKKYLDYRQYSNLTSTIIEADLLGTGKSDEKQRLETYRKIMIDVRNKLMR